jgi:phasin family protein
MAKKPETPMEAATETGRTAFDAAQKMGQQFTQLFGQMKLPSMVDVEPLLAAQRRNIEVLTAANRVAMEGAQAVARRHMEIMQQSMSEMTETVRALATTTDPATRATKQAELLKHAYEKAVVNLQELSDMIQHANGEAVGLLNHRFTEAMDEVKSLIAKSKT